MLLPGTRPRTRSLLTVAFLLTLLAAFTGGVSLAPKARAAGGGYWHTSGRQILDATADPDPGRVDEHVEPPEEVAVFGDGAVAGVRVGHVRRDRRAAQLRCRRLDALGSARDERQVEPLVAQHPGDREPDARRAAGDECSSWHCAYSKRPWKLRAS